MNFFPFHGVGTISPRSMLFITGEKAHTMKFREDAYELTGQPKERLIVQGAGHVDLYDHVDEMPGDDLSAFLKRSLAAN
jgi:fermentation-respiration switch protein FrsA (DUF1100 family)